MKWFPRKKNDQAKLKKAADDEMAILDACMTKVNTQLYSFSDGIQEIEKEIEVAAQSIKDAQENGESKERIRTMKNDFRLLVRSHDKRTRMRDGFQSVYDLIAETYDLVSIAYEAGHYREVIEWIPEKSLPHLIASGDPADIVKLKNLLIDINKSLEEYLGVTVTERDIALADIANEEQATDVMTASSNFLDKEMEELEKRFNLGTDSKEISTAKKDEVNPQPVKVIPSEVINTI